MGDLTRNLSRHEFDCQCGCGATTADWELVTMIQDVCTYFTARVFITSGMRCMEHNNKPVADGGAGSNENSQHPKGLAADCAFKYVSAEKVYEYLCKRYPSKFGFGLYREDGFVHIDVRVGNAARWEV